MLTQLGTSNFKAAADLSVSLSPLTLFIGANGSGKTTILQAIDMLGWLVTHSFAMFLSEHQWEYSDLPYLHGKTTVIDVKAHLRLGGRSLTWTVALAGGRVPGVAWEIVVDEDNGKHLLTRNGRSITVFDERGGEPQNLQLSLPGSYLSTIAREDEQRLPGLVAIAEWARSIRGYFFLNPLQLRSPNRGATREIGTHGQLLAPFIASLRKKNPAGFERLVARVRRHYPRLVGLHTRTTRFGWTHLEVTERWDKSETRFSARQVSDGLLRMIAVAAMHELGTAPSVVLLDEIENGLHPHLLGGLIEMLRDLVRERKGAMQVVATTHSPIAVNYCEPAEVGLVGRTSDGKVRVLRLSESDPVRELSKQFDLGELWYNLGEEKLRR